MYEVIARVYDAALAGDYAPRIRAELDRALAAHGPAAGRRVLDAGCGTGLLACGLAQEGWEVTGLDISGAMLERARGRGKAAGCEVEWVEGDMRRFRRESGFDLVVCFYDALNHLMTNSDLMRALRCFHDSLSEDGLLAFDVNNRLAYWLLWGAPDPFEKDLGDEQISIHTTFDRASRVGEAQVELRADGQELRETLKQRFFSDTEIQGLLLAEGFEVLDVHDFRGLPEGEDIQLPEGELEESSRQRTGVWKDHPDPNLVKTFWLCRKKTA